MRDYLRLRNVHAEVGEGASGGVNFLSSVDSILNLELRPVPDDEATRAVGRNKKT